MKAKLQIYRTLLKQIYSLFLVNGLALYSLAYQPINRENDHLDHVKSFEILKEAKKYIPGQLDSFNLAFDRAMSLSPEIPEELRVEALKEMIYYRSLDSLARKKLEELKLKTTKEDKWHEKVLELEIEYLLFRSEKQAAAILLEQEIKELEQASFGLSLLQLKLWNELEVEESDYQILFEPLLKELLATHDSTLLARAYFEKGSYHYFVTENLDSAFVFLTKSIAHLEGKSKAYAIHLRARVLHDQSKLGRAIKEHKKAVQLAKQTHSNNLIANCMLSQAFSYSDANYNAEALELHLSLEKMMATQPVKYVHDRVFSAIAILYLDLGDLSKSEAYLKKQKAHLKNQDDKKIKVVLTEISALVYWEIGKPKKAYQLYQEGRELANLIGESKYQHLLGFRLAELLAYYTDSNQVLHSFGINGNKAKEQIEIYLRQAENYYTMESDLRMLKQLYAAQSYVYDLLEKPDKVKEAAIKLLEAPSITEDLEFMSEVHYSLYDFYHNKGLLSKAVFHLKEHLFYKDSLYKQTNALDIARVESESKYREEMQDQSHRAALQGQKISTLKGNAKRNAIIFGVTCFLLVILIAFVFLFYRQKRLKQKQKELIITQKLLLTQMNPHFLSNSLMVVLNQIDKQNYDLAKQSLHSFSKLTRTILESSRNQYIRVEQEIELLHNFLKLNQSILGSKAFSYELNVDEEIDPEAQIPPMLIQPFIENAIEHGVKPLRDKGKIDIGLAFKSEGLIEVYVKDNGVGYNKKLLQSEKQQKRSSHSIDITKERISIFNQKQKQEVSLDIKEGNNAGLEVRISIPVR